MQRSRGRALALPALYLSYYLREKTPGWVFLVYGFGPLLVLLPDLVARFRSARLEDGTGQGRQQAIAASSASRTR